MIEIRKYKFDELYSMSSGITTSPDQAGHGHPFLSFSTVFNNIFIPQELPDLMNTDEKEQKTFSIRAGDIFLTRTSETLDELAMSCVALKDYPCATFSGFVKRLRPIDSEKVYPKFIAFYLRSPIFRKTITNNAVMTLRASFNEAIFSYLYVNLPSYNDQVKIGDFLYSIYEKIEVDKSLKLKFENFLSTIYSFYFINFNCLDSDKNKKLTFNNILNRDIPIGWNVVSLSDICDIRKGDLITEKTADTSGCYKVVSAGISNSYMHSEFNREFYTITVSASGASAGYVNFWRERIFASDCITIRGNTDALTFYIYEYLKTAQNYIFSQARGSAQPHVYSNDLYNLKILIPPNEILEKFSNFAFILNEKIRNSVVENNQLTTLYNWLLPMLMNGMISIRDTEEHIAKTFEQNE